MEVLLTALLLWLCLPHVWLLQRLFWFLLLPSSPTSLAVALHVSLRTKPLSQVLHVLVQKFMLASIPHSPAFFSSIWSIFCHPPFESSWFLPFGLAKSKVLWVFLKQNLCVQKSSFCLKIIETTSLLEDATGLHDHGHSPQGHLHVLIGPPCPYVGLSPPYLMLLLRRLDLESYCFSYFCFCLYCFL